MPIVPKKRKLSQFKRAADYIFYLRDELSPLMKVNDNLRNVLGEAQNSPPEGFSDGSFDAETWQLASNISTKIHSLEFSLTKFLSHVDNIRKEGI